MRLLSAQDEGRECSGLPKTWPCSRLFLRGVNWCDARKSGSPSTKLPVPTSASGRDPEPPNRDMDPFMSSLRKSEPLSSQLGGKGIESTHSHEKRRLNTAPLIPLPVCLIDWHLMNLSSLSPSHLICIPCPPAGIAVKPEWANLHVPCNTPTCGHSSTTAEGCTLR